MFEVLKKRFTTEPILVVLDLNKKMRMEINISDYIIGRVLSVQYTNGKWRLVAYLSKSLSETEQNYKIYNKEILAVIKELEA